MKFGYMIDINVQPYASHCLTHEHVARHLQMLPGPHFINKMHAYTQQRIGAGLFINTLQHKVRSSMKLLGMQASQAPLNL